MEMTDAFIRNITFDWNRGTKKLDMRNKFGIIPYIDDIEELFKSKEALVFYVQIILQTEPMPHVVKCYESFLAKAQRGK